MTTVKGKITSVEITTQNYYINIKQGSYIETIDEFETREEASKMLSEYQMAYRGTGYNIYISTKPDREWNDGDSYKEWHNGRYGRPQDAVSVKGGGA